MNTDDAGSLDEVQIIPRDLTTTEVSDLYNGVEKSHMSKTYQDGLGRTTRSVVMDMFGTKIQTVATLGWNDQPVYAYLPSGQYSAFTYDFLGRTLSSQSPGDSTISGISKTTVSEKTRMIESIDAVGRKAYIKTDLLGRTVETAVWNPQTSAYGNRTNASYNALSEVTVSKDAKGQTMTVYYNSLGKPKMTVFPDSTDAAMRYSLVYYDDNLRPFQTVDVMGRVAVSTYDSIGRVTKVSLRAPPATTTYDTFYDYDSHDDLLVIQNGTVNGNRAATGTATITRTYDSLHRMKTEELRIPSTGTAEFDKTVTYAYDNASKVATITYPISGNPYAYYIYDSLGRVKEAGYNSGGVGLGQGVLVYDSFGRLGSIYYWKGATNTTLQEKYTYDARDRVTQVKVFDTGSTYMQLDYVYNKASEIRWSTDNMYVLDGGGVGSNPKNVTYAYDGNGRLSYSSGPYGSSQATQYNCYDYDAVGNIAHHNVSGTGTPTSCTTGTGPIVYTYNPTGWNQLSSITNLVTSFTYNTAGSMLTKVENSVTTTYSQDFLQQLVKAVSGSNTYTYSYDGLGRRVKTVEPTIGTSYFMYAGSKMLYSKVGTTPTETAYVYVGNKLLLRKEGTLDARYYHQDMAVW
ncbi:hypothetical protein AUG19_03205 [archaeon 13_1_20CM_2_54_9]|nr:MAG: hypothetical protein AUG19_03205 [archaeon 13_1_20CM_2_54_9]